MAVTGRRSTASSTAAVRSGQAGRGGRAGRLPAERAPAGAPPRRGIELQDEPLGDSNHPEFEPVTASAQTQLSPNASTQVLEFSASRGRTALLEQVVVGTGGLAAVTVTLNGQRLTSLSNGEQVRFGFGGAPLPYGGHVRIRVQDLSGSGNPVGATVITRVV